MTAPGEGISETVPNPFTEICPSYDHVKTPKRRVKRHLHYAWSSFHPRNRSKAIALPVTVHPARSKGYRETAMNAQALSSRSLGPVHARSYCRVRQMPRVSSLFGLQIPKLCPPSVAARNEVCKEKGAIAFANVTPRHYDSSQVMPQVYNHALLNRIVRFPRSAFRRQAGPDEVARRVPRLGRRGGTR